MANVPNAVDSFSRFMTELYDERDMISVPTGFQAFFGNPMNGSKTVFSPDSTVIDIDILRGNEKTAALIPRGNISRSVGSNGNQKNVRLENFTNFSRTYPLSIEETDLTGNQILRRVAGENPYEQRTRMMRLRMLGRDAHMENMRRMIRLSERLAAQSILTGKMPAILGTTDTNQMYDFQRNSDHTMTIANKWNGNNADILGDIDTACDRVRANGKVNPDVLCMGGLVMDAFIKDTTVDNVADNRRFELIMVSTNNPVPPKLMHLVDSGWIPRGRLRTPKGYELWLFTYTDVYEDEAGAVQKYMPDTSAFICSSMARCDRYFGPPEQLPMIPMREQLYREFFGMNASMPMKPANVMGQSWVFVPAAFYCDAYVSTDWLRITIRDQYAPIFATTATDMFVTLNSVVTV